jgi:hypothetical protein
VILRFLQRLQRGINGTLMYVDVVIHLCPELFTDDENDLAANEAGDHEITATAAVGDLEIAVADAGDCLG